MISDEEYSRWLMHLMNYYGRYHNHKETMAWVATAFFITGIISFAFASGRVVDGHCIWQTIFSIFVAIPFIVLSGVLALCFICWQFCKRRVAANNALNVYNRLKNVYGDNQLIKVDDPPTGYISELLTYLAVVGATIVGILIVCIGNF